MHRLVVDILVFITYDTVTVMEGTVTDSKSGIMKPYRNSYASSMGRMPERKESTQDSVISWASTWGLGTAYDISSFMCEKSRPCLIPWSLGFSSTRESWPAGWGTQCGNLQPGLGIQAERQAGYLPKPGCASQKHRVGKNLICPCNKSLGLFQILTFLAHSLLWQ